ncbi:integrin beta-1-like [Labrus mixtus]|uniref:integrin beta-1-like n=1 Tax=Labrus mixtus TaxID=508554 RepID=UPI0029C0E858|nr:integrin beta-1-like [Labrus mixtus]
MDVKLLGLSLLLVLFCPGWAKEKCLKSASSCEQCLQSGPECAWCIAPQSNIRCHTSNGLQRAGCHKSNIYNPQGRVDVVRNEIRTEPVNAVAWFLQPQELSLRLRPGVSQFFPLTITMPTDQPISEVNLVNSSVPTGVNITFRSVVSGNPLVIEVNVEADQCPNEIQDSNQSQNLTGPWSVHITPRGFTLGVKLEITLECQCECTSNREKNSPSCGGHGSLVCGQCECNEPYTGLQCQTDSSYSPDDDFCHPGPNAPACSGRGKCVDSFCECDKPVNPAQIYSGHFCECSNFDCPRHNGRICGNHGRCICGSCICDDDWTGEDCGCTMDTSRCMTTDNRVCNDKGLCECGVCRCSPEYAGPTCETCPMCPGRCVQHGDCVECLAFRTGAKKDRCDQDCGYLTVTVMETERSSPQPGEILCKKLSHEDSCAFNYTLQRMPSRGERAVVWPKECPYAL